MPDPNTVDLLTIEVDGVPYPFGEGRLAYLMVHDWASVVAPMAEMALNDNLNILVEIQGFTGTEVFRIGVGNSEDDIDYTTYRLFSTSADRYGGSSHMVKLLLIAESAIPLLSPARFKSYRKSTVSDVVKAIATELGFTTENVEKTSGEFNLFCPGWTYAQFLAYLSGIARSDEHGTSGFMFFVDTNNSMHFYSAEYAKNRNVQASVVRKDVLDPSVYKKTDLELGPYRAHQYPMLLGNQAGWGLTSAFFDFDHNKFVEVPLTVDGSQGNMAAPEPSKDGGFSEGMFERVKTQPTKLKGLADNLSMLESYTDGRNIIINGGVQNDLPEIALQVNQNEARLVRAVNSMNKLELILLGNLKIKAGGLVNVQIGSVLPQNAVNQTFSGKWLVENVTHQFSPTYVSKVTLFRAGVSGSDKARLLKPPGGVVD